ncbi:MAG TPA: response regulator [Saprospiraceae bacterium]|nr:response regulator [Saprospiraceae bacterium]
MQEIQSYIGEFQLSELGFLWLYKNERTQLQSHEWKIQEVNPEFSKMVGIDSEMLINQSVRTMVEKYGDTCINWQRMEAMLTSNQDHIVYEQYSASKNKWYKIEINCLDTLRWVVLVNDITENKEYQNAMELLVKLAKEFIHINPEEVNAVIHKVLEEIGKTMGADRAYIFTYDFTANTCSNTYEWCAEGISAEIETLQDLDLNLIPHWVAPHLKGKEMYIQDIYQLPPGDEVRNILEPQNIQSLIAIPMMKGAQPIGFVGFDSVKKKKVYSDREKNVLMIFAELMVNLHLKLNYINQLSEAKLQAEAANVAKSKFIANISHEFRTPLNSIIGFTDILLTSDVEASQRQYLENVSFSGKTLLSLINDLLDISKIEAGKIDLEFSETNIIELAEKALDLVNYQASNKGVELLLRFDMEIPFFANIDPVRLNQILVNLLGNGVKFTESGEVELNISFTPLNDREGIYHFSIKDTGIGISQDQLTRIFNAFDQGDSSTTRKYGGSGLGLTIARMLVEKMGSQLKVSSKLGEGSTFSFSIITGYNPKNETFQNVFSGKRAAIVDDNIQSLDIVTSHMKHWGMDCILFDNSKEALRNLIDFDIDVLILDKDMPHFGGIDILNALRDQRQYVEKSIPVILMKSITDNSKEVEKGGWLFHLTAIYKPIKINDLYQSIEQSLRIHRLGLNVAGKQDLYDIPDNQRDSKERKILLVEDVLINRFLIKTMLEKVLSNVVVFEASNGWEALDLKRKIEVDLILMDIQMPECDGLEATKLIREMDKSNETKVPVIGLSAGASKEEKDEAFKAGMNDYLTKPVKIQHLRAILDKY